MDNYILISWPDIQEYMEEDWFKDEAILANSINESSSSYFIPEKRIIDNDYIVRKVLELSKLFKVKEIEFKEVENEWNKPMPFEGGMGLDEHIIDIKSKHI